MNDKTKQVLIGWASLSESERHDLEEEIRRYRTKTLTEQEDFRKGLTRVTVGPLGSTCPCCGR